MLRGEEHLRTAVEQRGLLRSLYLVEGARMAHDAIGEHMVALILLLLIDEVNVGLWRVEERETQGVVVGLVPAVARVVHNGHTVVVGDVGEICPAMGIDLELVVAVVATLHAAEADVVSGSLIADIQREDGLQQGVAGAPVHLVLEVDACCLFALIEVDALHDVRLAILLPDHDGLA